MDTSHLTPALIDEVHASSRMLSTALIAPIAQFEHAAEVADQDGETDVRDQLLRIARLLEQLADASFVERRARGRTSLAQPG